MSCRRVLAMRDVNEHWTAVGVGCLRQLDFVEFLYGKGIFGFASLSFSEGNDMSMRCVELAS